MQVRKLAYKMKMMKILLLEMSIRRMVQSVAMEVRMKDVHGKPRKSIEMPTAGMTTTAAVIIRFNQDPYADIAMSSHWSTFH
jgi:hypothetical protein